MIHYNSLQGKEINIIIKLAVKKEIEVKKLKTSRLTIKG